MTATARKLHAEFDRIPPYSEDAERAVLGACLLSENAFGSALEILDAPDAFYYPAHVAIYEAMLDLYRRGKPIDINLLRETLGRQDRLEYVGGLSYIADLSSSVPTSANVAHYAQTVRDKALLRGLITCGTQMVANAHDWPAGDDVANLLDSSEADLFRLAERRQTNAVDHIGTLLPDAVARIEAAYETKSGCTGIGTGFKYLDNLTSGFQPGDMIVLAARPSVGKSSFALHVALRAALQEQRGVLIFSLEMNKASLVQRLLCAHAGVNMTRLRTGFLRGDELARLRNAADDLQGIPIAIDDTASISSMEFRAKARRHAAKHQTDLIIVDYLQLMVGSSRSESRQVEVSEISKHIKSVGRELNVPVLALSQLNRLADAEEGRPRLSHLRESGSIEQDADLVLLMSRERQTDPKSEHQMTTLDLAKQRNGPTGEVRMVFEKGTQRWFEPATEADAAKAPARLPHADDHGAPYGDDEGPFDL